MCILSGDIGGTSTRLQMSKLREDNTVDKLVSKTYASGDYDDFCEIILLFLKEHPPQHDITRACFAVAGPIIEGSVQFTNLPWVVSEQDIASKIGIPSVNLINDFQAIGYGIETLEAKDYCVLQKGEVQPGKPKALIGAGTGLGMGIVVPSSTPLPFVLPTEGGHSDFAPVSETQVALYKDIAKKYHRVSYERLVSGQGLVNIYNFAKSHPLFEEQENPALRLAIHRNKEDIAATISRFATEEHDPLAVRALDIFVKVYGACAGNLALTTLPYGGLYVVGGIAPKILKQIKEGYFMNRFRDKGRMSDLLEDIPVYVVKNTDIGIQGAALYAALSTGVDPSIENQNHTHPELSAQHDAL